MPPKKATAATITTGEAESGAFRWTPENERRLLVLTQGRQLNGAEYERLLTVFPGTNLNGVRIRCSRLRVEQRKLYEEYGWDLDSAVVAGGATAKKTATTTGKKRGAVRDEGGEESPKKRGRAKKEKLEAEEDAEQGESGEMEGDELKGGVKEEVLDDEKGIGG
ncbi:hypothetical protein T440DRAFT_539868 [Plenodomus tracheiphilus IPT5]|uniref:Myb-like domain-containing protein n=1 Tax=Plenodomus tracheiphilus IPT5 TaxID=1408161 RepID=A0A6A7AYS9_9PLEO|nr:hypothetical protein T440DRAFT_539868 [Plenodomus tracheiphilus IPT5]